MKEPKPLEQISAEFCCCLLREADHQRGDQQAGEAASVTFNHNKWKVCLLTSE